MAVRAARRSGVGGLLFAFLLVLLFATEAGQALVVAITSWAGDWYASRVLGAVTHSG